MNQNERESATAVLPTVHVYVVDSAAVMFEVGQSVPS